jgi:hypothetical protein
LGFAKAPLGIVKVSSQLAALVPVLVGVFYAQLQGLVVVDELLQFFLVTPPQMVNDFLVLELPRLEVRLDCLVEALRFKVALTDLVKVHGLGVKFETVLVLQVFLDPHAQDVLIHWQLHLLRQMLNLCLLVLDHGLQLRNPLFKLLFLRLAGRDLIYQLILVACALTFDTLEMLLEIVEELGQLVLLHYCVL